MLQIYLFSIVVSNTAVKWCHEHVPSQSKLKGEEYSKAETLLGRKEIFSFLGPPPQAPGICRVSSFCITKGFLFLCNMASYFFPLKFCFISSCGSVWGFSEFHWCFFRWLLSTGLWCCCGLRHKHLLGLTQVEPNLPPGKAGLEVLPILFLHFFLFIQLPGFLSFLSVFSTGCHYLPQSFSILFCDALIMSFCHVQWLHLVLPPLLHIIISSAWDVLRKMQQAMINHPVKFPSI